MFLEKTPAVISSMQNLLEDEDWPAMKAIAHKFKSSIDFTGSKQLDQITIDLEKHAEMENKPEIEKAIAEIAALCEAIYKEIKIELNSI
jgi:HPt (histidine-containing phosphotransfer) domain-containing protein